MGQFVPFTAPLSYGMPNKSFAAGAFAHGKLNNNVQAQMQDPILMQATPTDSTASSPIADYAKQGLRPLFIKRINGYAPTTKYISRPPVPVPQIKVIEEYRTCSYLGNYGAGKVLKTFSLFPGERTTISITTYEDQSSSTASGDNMLDSVSDSSATELDKLLQQEQGNMNSTADTTSAGGSNYNTTSDSKNSSNSANISANIDFGIGAIGGGYGQSQGETSTSGGGMSNTYNQAHTSIRTSNMNSLSNALAKHVQQSNAARQIDISHNTSTNTDSGTSTVTVRELVNVNKSRVLNFVFRQLLQEYISITSLVNLKFLYTNGYPESTRIVDLSNLPNMLQDIIDVPLTDPDRITNMMCTLLKPYCNVLDYLDGFQQFIEAKTITIGGCLTEFLPSCVSESETLWRKNKDCVMYYDPTGLDVEVKGVILNVDKHTLLTSSAVCDALLGQGEALDCFNQKAQDAENMATYINNLSAMQQLERNIQDATNAQTIVDQQVATLDAIPLPNDKATLYKKVYGDCCDVPQSCCGCGCGAEEGTH